MRSTLAVYAAVRQCLIVVVPDDLTMTAVRPLRISVRGALGCGSGFKE
jgi:hypothetical protein